MAEAETLEISLLGRSYKIACPEGERDNLLQAVAYLDGKMQNIKQAGKIVGTERIAVMVALNIAHEMLSLNVGGGLDLGEAKRRISAMQAQLDDALARQDQLF